MNLFSLTWLFFGPFFLGASNSQKVVYILPPIGYHNEKLFDMHDPILNRDDVMRPFFLLREELRSRGYDLKTTLMEKRLRNFAGLIVCHMPYNHDELLKIADYPKEKTIAILLEPPVIVPYYYQVENHALFGKVLIMLDDYIDNKKYFKLYYPQPSLKMVSEVVPFKQKKFCTLIAAYHILNNHPQELYSERAKIIEFFESEKERGFEFYGFGWNPNIYWSYKGSVDAKVEVLKRFKFCICYENMKDIHGYVTEKIFDVMTAGCVPVYWGAKNIREYVDADCFIWREDFKSNEELYAYLKNMSESEYNSYIHAISRYLQSEMAYPFSKEFFVSTIIQALNLN